MVAPVILGIPVALKVGGLLAGGALAGMGISSMFGGTPQAQAQKQESKIESPIEAPIKYETITTYDQRDYSKTSQDTITKVLGSAGANVGVSSTPSYSKPQTMTPTQELIQSPIQDLKQEPKQIQEQTAGQTSTQDPTGGLLMIGLLAGGGYIVYNEFIKKKAKK